MLEVLDAIIATAAVVLGLSLAVQGLQQIVKQWLDLKSNYMRFQLLAMFSPPTKPAPGFRALAPVTVQSRQADQRSQNIVKELSDAMRSFGYKDLELVETLDTKKLKEIVAMLPMFAGVKAEVTRVHKEIDVWFDVTKKAFQDLYERRMKLWSFLMSAAVVITLNANIIEIYREFSTSKPLRDAAIAWAEKTVALPRDSVITAHGSGGRDSLILVTKTDTELTKSIETNLSQIQSMLGDKSFQLLRWSSHAREELFDHWLSLSWFQNWGVYLLGWLGMTVLVSLGAPFWYDLLKTVVGIKESLNARSRSAKSASDGG